MRNKHNHKKEEAIKLRLEGKSYNEIRKALGVPSKGTLSYWFHNMPLPEEAVARLTKKSTLSRQKLIRLNKNRTRHILQENNDIRLRSVNLINNISKKELLLIGTSLYWGEGRTREVKRGYPIVSFSNTDPEMVKIFMRYVREVLEIEDEKIKPNIQIHPNISKEEAKDFWSKIIKLPKEDFHTYDAISRASKFKRPKNFLPYGTVNIRINSRQVFYRIKGFIDGITGILNK